MPKITQNDLDYFNSIKDVIEKELRDRAKIIGLKDEIIQMLVDRYIKPGVWFGHETGDQYVEWYLNEKMKK